MTVQKLCATLTAVLLPLAFVPGLLPAAHAAGNAAGKKDFVAMGCYQCHGYQGEGGGNGPRIAPNPLPLAAFREQLRHPRSVMPAYPPGQLSDARLQRIHDYLQSQPQPPSPDSIPALSGR